jgi:hypothetical protein
MNSKAARILAIAFFATLTGSASASTIDLFAIGSTHSGGALDPFNNPIPGVPIVSWTQTLVGLPSATTLLSILAEGIDGGPDAPGGGEPDIVYVNGVAVGELAQQAFYSADYNLRPGPGIISGKTAETLSIFDVTSLLVDGLNTFEVRIDTSNWVDEIEVASLRTLQQVPEPASIALAAIALLAISLTRRRADPSRRATVQRHRSGRR